MNSKDMDDGVDTFQGLWNDITVVNLHPILRVSSAIILLYARREGQVVVRTRGNGDNHGIAWYHEFVTGRAFYTDMNHTNNECEIIPQGAKNEALQVINAVLLSPETITINNIPDIVDVNNLIELIGDLGCKVEKLGTGSYQFNAASINTTFLETEENCRIDMLGLIPDVFQRLGIKMEFLGDDIFIPSQTLYEIDTFIDGSLLTIADAPWPGFTPDLLSIVLVVATQAKGSVLIHQKMFESRLFFVDKLIEMGAQIILCDPHRANVIGLERKEALRGINMSSPDIRAGMALLIAALSAKGTSKISNIEQIDRGYQNIEGKLKALGADIERM
ncbi:hypothetical protein M407DRAFT_218884 [Tulasnella calospora MUT 4182]|uniref:UDP-N-acetylglucosamine 1-carboxyvinyltransferase n=1 Tax=Tulasnella calospora MUT 4182 TaxID=1051891 RepID=A0A0C3MD35_9AGAM|nr:hypothetical protein M407DRAFT_218884 [Tulasnella calospora MUT 4182]